MWFYNSKEEAFFYFFSEVTYIVLLYKDCEKECYKGRSWNLLLEHVEKIVDDPFSW